MKPSKTTVIALSTICLALAAGWAFLIYGSYSLREEIRQASTAETERTAESSYVASLRTLLREEKNNIDVINGIFISEEGIPAFVESLEAKASSSKVDASIGSLDLASTESGSSIAPLSIGIVGKGSWSDLIAFISALDSLPTASKINSVSLSKIEVPSPETKEVAWNARIDFTQYVEKANPSSK